MTSPAYPAAAIGALTGHQRQIDSDGAFVGVSREALDEVIAWAQAQRQAEPDPADPYDYGWFLDDADPAWMAHREPLTRGEWALIAVLVVVAIIVAFVGARA